MERIIDKPLLSIIIASYNSQDTILRCLESLEKQRTKKCFEVILVDSSLDSTAELVKRKFKWVSLLCFPERKFPGEARNIGISEAKGEIIAFIDSDCIASNNWVEEIFRAHNSSDAAIGSSIANCEPCTYVSWAAYFCEYSKWMPGGSSKTMLEIAATGMTYDRNIFERYGKFLEGTYCSDTDFHWRMARSGTLLKFDPVLSIAHISISGFRNFLGHEYFHGRSFAKVRIKSNNFSGFRRAVYSLLSFLIPIRILLKIGVNNIKNRVYLMHFVRTLPLLVMGVISWSMGECKGYFKGR